MGELIVHERKARSTVPGSFGGPLCGGGRPADGIEEHGPGITCPRCRSVCRRHLEGSLPEPICPNEHVVSITDLSEAVEVRCGDELLDSMQLGGNPNDDRMRWFTETTLLKHEVDLLRAAVAAALHP